MIAFQKNRRYRIEYLPAGARSKTVTVEANYLGPLSYAPGVHEFDGRASTPSFGTARLHIDQIKDAKDIGVAIWERRS